MIRDFNILATTYRRAEGRAASELRYLLEQIGDAEAVVDRTGISGLIVARTRIDPSEVIRQFRLILDERPYEFRYLLRVIPIQKVVSTDLKNIAGTAEELGSKIGVNESFRITVEKRFTSISSGEIVEAAAEGIRRKVNLSNPDKILLIEVLGGLTGVAVVEPHEILSVLKEKIL